MTDWKWYFQVRESLEDQRERQKQSIQRVLSRHPSVVADRSDKDLALSIFKHMASQTVFVIAYNYQRVKEFARNAQLNIRNVRFVSDADTIKGVEGATIVLLGDWSMNTSNFEILEILNVRNNIDKWIIQEW